MGHKVSSFTGVALAVLAFLVLWQLLAVDRKLLDEEVSLHFLLSFSYQLANRYLNPATQAGCSYKTHIGSMASSHSPP